MSLNVQFTKRSVKIADLLNSPIMVGQYRGEEVWGELTKLMDDVLEGTLVLFDIREAMPLQYTFCQYAFGPLLDALNTGKWLNKYVIFQMHDFHRSGFFRGVLKYLRADLPRKEAEKEFAAAGFYVKIIIGDEEPISFVGILTENQKRTLAVVNELKEVTTKEVVEKLCLPEEHVVDALRFLVNKYFIVRSDAQRHTIPHYLSFDKYFGKE
jgi:hypothetical protein